MSDFQICACGSAPGYPHRPDCPRPLYNPSDAQFEAWEKDWLKMKTQHTPTPWNYSNTTHRPVAIFDTMENCIATIHQPFWHRGDKNENHEETVANAEFIVRACNAHDELVKALKRCLPWLGKMIAEKGHLNSPNDANDAIGAMYEGQDAIAKAEGKLP